MQEEFNPFPSGEALEALCVWSNNLKSFRQRIGKYFARSEAKGAASDYIQALLCPVERKNGWQMAEQIGYTTPYRLQHLLGRAIWDEEQVCAEVRDYVVEHLDDGAGILAVDETSFLKRGEESVGVGRQYCGLTGQIENCQVGVFLAYISSQGQSLLDRRLYLPKSWTTVSKRRQKAKIPRKVRFATKTGLAKGMLQSAFKAGIHPAWFVADEVYSRDASFWRWLEQEVKQPYVLTVNKRQPTPINFQTCYAEDLVQTVQPENWQRLSTGAGTKGERYYDWARVKLNCRHPEGFSRWFLFRRCPEHPDDPTSISYYQVFAPSDTSLETMVGVAGSAMANRGVFSIYQRPTGLRGLRSALMDGLASPHHFGPGSRSFLVCAPLSSRTTGRTLSSSIFFSSHRGWQSGCVQGGPWALVRLSLVELRRWVGRLLFPRFWSLALLLHWSFWRRHHQALARYHHYRKRSQAP